jgi:ribose transport system permease protein
MADTISLIGKAKALILRIRQSRETGLFLLLVLIVIIMSISTPIFFTSVNLLNILKQITLIAIVACGQTFALTSGGIDLSVGYTLGLSSIIISWFTARGMPTVPAIVICLGFGTFIGILNGTLITRLSLPPFIVTFSMASITRGFVNVITKGYPIMVDNKFIIALGQGSWGTFPIMIIFIPIVIIVSHWIFNYTVFGLRIKSIGGNETAARLSGIKVRRVKVLTYAYCGFLCGLAGLIITGRLNSGSPQAGLNFDMDSIAAVIVGGTALSGGSGTIIGTLLGALLMCIIRNGLVLLHVNMFWQTVATGTIIILVCALDGVSRRKGEIHG